MFDNTFSFLRSKSIIYATYIIAKAAVRREFNRIQMRTDRKARHQRFDALFARQQQLLTTKAKLEQQLEATHAIKQTNTAALDEARVALDAQQQALKDVEAEVESAKEKLRVTTEEISALQAAVPVA